MPVGSCKRRAHCRMPLTASLRCEYDDIHIIFCPALQCSSTNRSEFEFYYGTHTGTHTYTQSGTHTHTHSERLRRAHTFATSANDVKMSFAGNERRHRRQKVEPQLEPEIGDQLSCRWAAAFGYQITPIHTRTHTHRSIQRHPDWTHTHTQGQQLTALPCSKFAASSEQKAHKVRK